MSNAHPEADPPFPGFPTTRPRRLRYHPLVRELVRETELSPRDFILPLFVRPGKGVRQEIASMPGNFQLSVDTLVDEVGRGQRPRHRGVHPVRHPGIQGRDRFERARDEGIVQQALRALRKSVQERRAAHHRRVLLRVHRPRPLRRPPRSPRREGRGQRRDAADPRRSSASATPRPAPTWSPRAA